MAAEKLTVTLGKVWCNESPVEKTEGISLIFSVTVLGASTCTSPTVKAYKKKQDVSSTVFPSGSASVSQNIITLPAATGFVGTGVYVIAVTFTEGGNVNVIKFQVKIQKVVAEQ